MFRSLTAKRAVQLGAAPVAVLAAAGLVWNASHSAFSDTTSNPTSNWAAGTVDLTDDDTNTAMFNVTNLKPGSTGSKCIQVTSSGSLPSAVKLYTSNYSNTNALGSYIDVKVEEGTPGNFSSCGSFSGTAIANDTLAALSAARTNFSNGVGSWTTTGGSSETKTYKFTYTVKTSTPDSAQGGSAALGFTWEAQNT